MGKGGRNARRYLSGGLCVKICLLGEFSGNLDEGMRIVSFHLAGELSKKNQVLKLDLRDIFTFDFWGEIRRFHPDIVHYIHGPTIKSFIITKSISIFNHDTKVVMSAMRPIIPYPFRILIPFLKPNMILTQSQATEAMFKQMGCKTVAFPCGVDVKKFNPILKLKKKEFRKKYGISQDIFLIFHVGSIKEGRNVRILTKLQDEENQVLIVGSSTTGINSEVLNALEDSGCMVWPKYIENIEDIYIMSDCYVYPTISQYDFIGRVIADSIEMPLSVLEAMSFNLPVISTEFGALPRFFEEGDGLVFFKSDEEICESLKRIKDCAEIRTREKVLPYAWENIGQRLENLYFSLIGERL
jgi:glycosyltransferase involved in cell wall biosynthesis